MKTKYNDNPLAFRTGPITVILPVEVSEPEADVIYDIIKHLRDQCIFNLLRIDAYMAKSDCLNDKELSGYIKVARIESYDDLSRKMFIKFYGEYAKLNITADSMVIRPYIIRRSNGSIDHIENFIIEPR